MKKFGILLIVAVMIAASSLTACRNKNSSSEGSKTESEAMYNLDIALEYRENNSELAEEVTVQLDGKVLWTVAKGELHQSIESVPAGQHVVTVYGTDESDQLGEVTVTMEKDSVVKVILENDTMNAEIQG